jgi:betaine lipid synthase
VPFLRAPYYVWVGHVPQLATVLAENKVEAPPMFPPTFLYTMSWEDPRPDMEVHPHRPSPRTQCHQLIRLIRSRACVQGLCIWSTSELSWCAPQVLKINSKDTVLTLTSGGCNSLNLLLHGAGQVVSVDCNPAQSALLELKAVGIR